MAIRQLTALPVFNEEAHLLDVLPEVRKYSQDILVVDDGSTDRTPHLLSEMDGIAVIRHEKNSGYGAGLKTAFDYAVTQGYDALVTIDCDGQHQPQLIPDMVAALVDDTGFHADIVSGSRYLREFNDDNAAPEDRRRINWEITRQLNECLHLSLTDSFCGFKAYRVELLPKLEIDELGYAMPLQLWVQAVGQGMQIIEFPVPRIYLDEKRSFGGSLDDSHRRMAYYQQVIQREMRRQQLECGASTR